MLLILTFFVVEAGWLHVQILHKRLGANAPLIQELCEVSF